MVPEQFPALASTLEPPVATESMMELANVFRGDFETREGRGHHDFARWKLFFDTIHEIGQISKPIAPEDVLTNDFVAPANDLTTPGSKPTPKATSCRGIPGDQRRGDPRPHLTTPRPRSRTA
jgi:hypothetical protein